MGRPRSSEGVPSEGISHGTLDSFLERVLHNQVPVPLSPYAFWMGMWSLAFHMCSLHCCLPSGKVAKEPLPEPAPCHLKLQPPKL